MIRATVANCLNYVTTLLAQVLLARRFGTGSAAAAYAITFGIMAALSGSIGSAAQSVLTPRLLDETGAYRRGALRLAAWLVALAFAIGLTMVATAESIASLLGRVSGLDTASMTSLLRLAGGSIVLQSLAGVLVPILLLHGQRFLPAVAPAFPSIVVAIALGTASIDIVTTFEMFAIGSAVEVLVLAVVVSSQRRAVVVGPASRTGTLAVITLMQFAVLSMLPPLERVLAASHDAAGAARYDYASRSLASVQSVVIGGLVLAGLGTWSALAARGDMAALRASFLKVGVLAAAALILCASLAIVSARGLVGSLFVRGAFNDMDGDAVALLLLLCLPGFVAQGTNVVITTVLAATRRNAALLAIGFSHAAVRAVLVIALGAHWGAPGVAIGYSVSNVASLAGLVVITFRAALWPRRPMLLLCRPALLTGGTLLAATSVAVMASAAPYFVRALAVIAAFAALLVLIRPERQLVAWRGAR